MNQQSMVELTFGNLFTSISGKQNLTPEASDYSSVDTNNVDTSPDTINKSVKITPTDINFNDVFEGETYTLKFTIQNISPKTITFQLRQPPSASYVVSDSGKTLTLAPGLSTTNTITFNYTLSSPMSTVVPIKIEDTKWTLPVYAKKGKAVLAVEPHFIDFGRVNVCSPPVYSTIKVMNNGACPLRVSVDIKPTPGFEMSASPNKCRIKAYDSLNIRLQLLPEHEGNYATEFWVKGANQAVMVGVEVVIMEPRLVCNHPNTTGDFTLIDFPPTFLGAMRYETVVVSNKSAEPATFILLAEIRNEVLDLKAAKKKNINYNMFSVNPSEGKINALEGKIFTCIFKPEKRVCTKGWKSSVQPKEMDYLCFMRIIIVQVSDHGSQNDSDMNSEKKDKHQNDMIPWNPKMKTLERRFSSNELMRTVKKTEGLRLCLHGVVVNPILSIVPDALHFLEIEMNSEEVRILNLKNSSSFSFGYRYKRIAYVDVIPPTEYIRPGKSLEVIVKVNIKALGNYKKRFYFELYSSKNMTDKEALVTIGKTSVLIDAHVKAVVKKPKPKINSGISPEITHEVGFLVEEVTFTSTDVKIPRNAVVPVGGKLPKIHSKTAVVAFPNDMPNTLQSHYPDKVTRSILTGAKRYLPAVDNEMTYTKEEKEKWQKHKDFWTRYMRETADKLRPKIEARLRDYDLSCKKLYQFDTYKPRVVLPPPTKLSIDSTGETLVPLTPLQIYNIKIKPRELNFAQVAVNTDCEELMYVENLNSFLILIRILPGHSGVHIRGNEKITVEPRGTGAFKVVLHTNTLGKYNGSFKYIINENHVFEMPVSGEIVQKILHLYPEEVLFSEPKDNVFYLWYQPVLLKNPLKTSTKFSWALPDNCKSFKIQPVTGTVPSMSKMLCAIYYFPSVTAEYTVRPLLRVESGIPLTVKCVANRPKPDIFFINPVLNVGNIPLQLPTTANTTLFNASYIEVPFEVVTHQTNTDVIISPSKGFIRPRGVVVFTLTFTVVCVGTLDVIYTVQSHDCLADLRVVAQVIFPQISITPRELRLQRVRCFSYVSYLLTAANTSLTTAKVSFLMDKYIQFKVSLSSKYWENGLTAEGFRIKPGESQKFYLHFFPEDLATYEFYLPLKINDLIGPPMIESPHTWRAASYLPTEKLTSHVTKYIQETIPDQISCVLVECTVAPAKILFNKVDFKFTKSSRKDVTEDELIFTNPQDHPLVFSIGSLKNSSPFTLMFKKTSNYIKKENKGFLATLQPRESVALTVTFTPPGYGYYEDVSLVTLKDFKQNFSKQPYNYLRFHGVYKEPTLNCSSALVYFPTIPLQMEGVRSLHVIARDYEEEDEIIIQNLNDGKEMLKLSFNFIEGSFIPAGPKSQIPFNLTFYSTEPISFATEVIMKDRHGRSTSFTVIASADNCSLSTNAILTTKSLALPRIKFIDSEFVDGGGVDRCLSVISGITYGGVKLEEGPTRTSPIIGECTSFTVNDNYSTVQSITASLLMKQTIPTRTIHIFAVQDYNDGTEHTKTVRQATEKFLYELVFHCSYYWEIGKNVKWSTAYKPALQGAAARNSTLIKSVIEILEKCYGKDIRTMFGQANIVLPHEDIARVEKICATLQVIINFLKSQGGCLPHVEPKFLLDYDDYILYKKNNSCNTSRSSQVSAMSGDRTSSSTSNFEVAFLNQNEYEHLRTQCWLDVMLQIYKTLVLNTLPMTTKMAFSVDKEKEKQPSILKDKKGSYVAKKRENMKLNISEVFKEKINHNVYGRAEVCVLAWLNSLYERERHVIWGPDKIPNSKIVNNFVESLGDCLVFAAVTAAYCPYITDIYLIDMYTEPGSKEERNHNAVCITRAWQAIRLGFSIYPSDFKHPNSILMLMLSVHLYKVLPSYLPETIVKFSTPLTTDTEHMIPLVNNSNSRNIYTTHIIGDPYQFFNIENLHPLIVLKPKEKFHINIRFSARKTKTVTATMLLCGNCISPSFGVNRVYTLEGFASELPTSIVFNLTATLNKLTKISLPIVSPFLLMEETFFDIWYSEKKPTTDNFEAVPWSEVCMRKAPRRLYLTKSHLKLEGSEPSPLEIKIGCFTTKIRYFWLVFMNERTGDFIVQIAIKPKVKEFKEEIQVELVSGENYKCMCSELNVVSSNTGLLGTSRSVPRLSCPSFSWSKLLSPSCPWRTTVKVPSRNNDLWHTVKTMFELALEPSEKEFWSSHLETNIGLKLVQWMVGEEQDSVTEEINHIFQTSVNYTISCSSNYISFPPFLHIPDIRLQRNVDLLAHVNPDAPDNFVAKLSLTAEHKKEIRIYKIIFSKILCDNSFPECSESIVKYVG